jgi:hypothetical protein
MDLCREKYPVVNKELEDASSKEEEADERGVVEPWFEPLRRLVVVVGLLVVHANAGCRRLHDDDDDNGHDDSNSRNASRNRLRRPPVFGVKDVIMVRFCKSVLRK